MNPRIERLRESLEEPLLVTNPTNINYLFGFKSSNAALLVERERARLFTDFRYSEAARAVEGVEFEETKRALLKDLADRLSGPIGFEADFVSYSGYETLRGGAIEPVPRRGLVEQLRAVKDDDELASIRRACEITDRMFERLIAEPFVGRTERDVAWTIEQLFHDEGADAVAFETIVAAGPNSARPTAAPPTGRSAEARRSSWTRVASSAATCPTTRAPSRPGSSRRRSSRPTRSCSPPSRRASTRCGPASRASMPMRLREESSTRRSLPERSGTGSAMGLASRCTRLRACPWSRPTRWPRATWSRSSPGIYLEGRAGIRIEDNIVVTEGGFENLTGFRKDLITVG